MPTTGVINGTLMRITLGGDKTIYPTECSMSLSVETRETISKDSVASWSTSEAGTKSGTISFAGFYSEDTTVSAEARNSAPDIYALFEAGAAVSWELTTGVTGDTKYSGSGIITSFESSWPVDENSTYSGTITITGAVTDAAVV